MRVHQSRRGVVAAVALAALVALSSACSSDAASDSGNGGAQATTLPDISSSTVDDAVAPASSTASPAPTGEWPPADACSLAAASVVETISGQTLEFAPVAVDGEFAYGPSCEYTSATAGLFLTIYTYSADDMATYTEGWVDEGRATVVDGLGDSAILEEDPTINNSHVYVQAGGRAFSVQVTSFSDVGWTPAIVSRIASEVAAAIIG